MFAVRFDDLMRKMRAAQPPVELKKLITTNQGMPEHEVYLNLFLMPENDTIHVEIEDDNRTYTFFTIVPSPLVTVPVEDTADGGQ